MPIFGINRIRLEFKGYDETQDMINHIVLIESDWNLKFHPNTEPVRSVPVLIESDWNLKNFWFLKSSDMIFRINRIRLEFKVVTHLKGVQGLVGINRIRLEFKVFDIEFIRYVLRVLIESDWNLKYIIRPFLNVYVVVLIESDWNLKQT